jgi:hypothetical protein
MDVVVAETSSGWSRPVLGHIQPCVGATGGLRPGALRAIRTASDQADELARTNHAQLTELAAVGTALDAAARGTAGVVALSGEPGVGKSRLAGEPDLAAAWVSEDLDVLNRLGARPAADRARRVLRRFGYARPRRGPAHPDSSVPGKPRSPGWWPRG